VSGQERPSVAAAIDECRRHLHYLRDANSRIVWPLTTQQMEAPADELVATLDQFAFRFSRLQDTLGQKAFRAILVGSLREPFEDSALRDVLDRLEQLRLLPSAERWEEIRAARNSLAHDYPDTPAQRSARLNLAQPMVSEMGAILDALAGAV
jgi:uncharacterized protein with HEPN domain